MKSELNFWKNLPITSEHVQLEEKLEKFHPKLIISFGQQTYEILRIFYKLYNLPNYLRDIFGYNEKDSIPKLEKIVSKRLKS